MLSQMVGFKAHFDHIVQLSFVNFETIHSNLAFMSATECLAGMAMSVSASLQYYAVKSTNECNMK